MWRSRPPAQSRNSTVPLRNLADWLDLSASPAGFGIPGPEGRKACGSFFDRRNPCVNRSSILFLVLASFVFAMLSSGRIANFVMRSNNSIDVCANTPEPSRRPFVASGVSFEERLTLLVYFRLPLATVFSFTSQCANERRSTATETCFVSAGRSRTRANPLSSFGWARNLGLTGPYLHLRKIGARTRSAVASRMPPNFRVLLLPRAMTSRLAASGASGTLRNSALETRSVRKSIRA